MTREEFMEFVYYELHDDGDNNRANRIIDAADEYALEEQKENKGEISDGFHTFNQLYHQRAVLFAAIVNQNKDKAWKSWKHSDGKYCFDSNGEWFIVGVDTPEGSYTYHYSKDYWDIFKCQELECGKEWDGHTEEDVTRLLSLKERKIWEVDKREQRTRRYTAVCPECGNTDYWSDRGNYCDNCGCRMVKDGDEVTREEAIHKLKYLYYNGKALPGTLEAIKMGFEALKKNECKDCKYFEYDCAAKVDGIPLIVGHEMCNRWGDGCKTSEHGYCFLFEKKDGEEK